jgi:hypothetical protein
MVFVRLISLTSFATIRETKSEARPGFLRTSAAEAETDRSASAGILTCKFEYVSWQPMNNQRTAVTVDISIVRSKTDSASVGYNFQCDEFVNGSSIHTCLLRMLV